MDSTVFDSYIFSNELNLNTIAAHFGIKKKYKWEEPLALSDDNLKGVIHDYRRKRVYLFAFGGVTFINFAFHEIMDFHRYCRNIERSGVNAAISEYRESYAVKLSKNGETIISYDDMSTPQLAEYHYEIIATVLAKSAALHKTEVAIDELMDEIENIVDFLARGQFRLSDKQLARISAKILGYKYNSISYVMLLDEPAITWNNEESKDLYNRISELFELKDRYEITRHKTETLLDVTEVFTSLTHAKRDARLEWYIIILIIFETLIAVFELFWK